MIGTEFFICPSCMHVYKPTGGGGVPIKVPLRIGLFLFMKKGEQKN